MPSPMVAIVLLVMCGLVGSFLARSLLKGGIDLASTRTSVLLLLGLAVACYVNSFGNGFVWDDTTLIVDNGSIRNWHNWTRAFTSDLYDNPVTQAFYYRPLQSLSYRLDYSLWGLHPDGYHLLNILLHAGNAILVFLLVRRLAHNAALGLACGALFVVHPIHTQAVTYISGRADPLCAFFLLLTLWFYIQGRDKPSGSPAGAWIWHGLAWVSYAAALGSKEFAMILPVLLLAFEVCVPVADTRRGIGRGLIRLAPFVLLVGGYLLVRKHVFGTASPPASDVTTTFGPVVLCLRALAGYFSLLIAPVNLHMEQTVAFGGLRGAQLTVMGAFGLIAWVALIGMYWRQSRPTCFALLWFAIFFLPVSNLWRLNATLAEHWMYFPSIGFLWAGVAMVDDLLRRCGRTAARAGEIGASVVMFFLLAFTARTIVRNLDWHDEIRFYDCTIAAGGGTPRVHNNLGMALVSQRKDFDGAEREYRQALEIDPNYDAALNNLGLLYVQKKDYEKALPLFEQTLRVHPWRVEGYLNLATTCWELGRTNDTWKTFQAAADRFPQSAGVALRYGVFALQHGRPALAEEQLRRGQQIAPDSADLANALGGAEIEAGKADEAIGCLERAKHLDRFTTSPYVNLAYLYQKLGQYAAAERELLGAARLEPYNPEFPYRLGVLYWRAGQTNDARRAFNQALGLFPDFASAKQALQNVEAGLPYASATSTVSTLDLKLPQPGARTKKMGN